MRREGAFQTCCGRAFHARVAATENDRSPRVERRVDGSNSYKTLPTLMEADVECASGTQHLGCMH